MFYLFFPNTANMVHLPITVKHFVKTVEATSLKFCTVLKLLTLHLEQTIVQVKYTNYSNAHAQTFVLLNGEMAIVSTFSESSTFWSGHFGLSSIPETNQPFKDLLD